MNKPPQSDKASDLNDSQSQEVNFRVAFRYWLKLGFINFGGPAGQIALMHNDLVDRRKWISEERFLHALNFCMLLPGPEAQQLAVYIGWLLHGTRGGIIAGSFFVLPSIAVLLALSYIYARFGNVPFVIAILSGFKPVVVAIVVEAIMKIGKRALKRMEHFIIAGLAFMAIYFLHVPFPLIVFTAAILGLLLKRFNLPKTASTIEQSLTQTAKTVSQKPLLHSIKTFSVFVVLWAIPFVILIWWRGWESPLAKLYRFFTQAAFVTFGGAYAVLAYVTQAAVDSYGWLTQSQAVDGLALAETTPGPLIMVLQFIGFMSGWNNPDGLSQTTAGVISALITTYTTFLPSFMFILLGAPYIEKLRENHSLTSALSGVTAAVVGVILNLALVFGLAVIFPSGRLSDINWFAAIMSIAAFIALYRFKIDVLWVVLAGGAIGLLFSLLR
ncbi:MAG: chromate efflux transporter [Acidobacteriota bacterium]